MVCPSSRLVSLVPPSHLSAVGYFWSETGLYKFPLGQQEIFTPGQKLSHLARRLLLLWLRFTEEYPSSSSPSSSSCTKDTMTQSKRKKTDTSSSSPSFLSPCQLLLNGQLVSHISSHWLKFYLYCAHCWESKRQLQVWFSGSKAHSHTFSALTQMQAAVTRATFGFNWDSNLLCMSCLYKGEAHNWSPADGISAGTTLPPTTTTILEQQCYSKTSWHLIRNKNVKRGRHTTPLIVILNIWFQLVSHRCAWRVREGFRTKWF